MCFCIYIYMNVFWFLYFPSVLTHLWRYDCIDRCDVYLGLIWQGVTVICSQAHSVSRLSLRCLHRRMELEARQVNPVTFSMFHLPCSYACRHTLTQTHTESACLRHLTSQNLIVSSCDCLTGWLSQKHVQVIFQPKMKTKMIFCILKHET